MTGAMSHGAGGSPHHSLFAGLLGMGWVQLRPMSSFRSKSKPIPAASMTSSSRSSAPVENGHCPPAVKGRPSFRPHVQGGETVLSTTYSSQSAEMPPKRMVWPRRCESALTSAGSSKSGKACVAVHGSQPCARKVGAVVPMRRPRAMGTLALGPWLLLGAAAAAAASQQHSAAMRRR